MQKSLEIRQHNALTNARYEYTELQQDLLFFIISKLRKDEVATTYQLNIKELTGLTKRRYNAAYLHKATADMGSRVFEVFTEEAYQQIWMFQKVQYLKGQGIIEIKLTEDILPFLFDLKNNFTSFELIAALRLTSKYAKRIYPLCSQWKNVGETKKYDIKEFKKMVGLIDEHGTEQMKQISQLRSFVLDTAVKQINEHTDLHISYKMEKVHRTFKTIVFKVKPQALAETVPFELLSQTDKASLPDGLQEHQVQNVARILSEFRINSPALVTTILGSAAHVAACNKFAHDLKTGKIKAKTSPAGLLLTVLGLKKPTIGPLFEAD